MTYYATIEDNNGKIETVNRILNWEILGPFIYLNGTDFEIFYSSNSIKFIEINEGTL